MSSSRTIPLCLVFALACATLLAQSPPSPNQNAATPARASTSSQPHDNDKTTHKVVAAPVRHRARSRAATPPSPYKLPPSPPQVSYVDGQLTVVANNSTLADVLNAVQNKLGAQIEGVTPNDGDRVFGQFGPASPRAVCSKLLTGSAYDFILMGASENPDSIQRIILTGRSTEMANSSPATAPAPEQPSAATEDANDSQEISATPNQVEAPNQLQMTPEQQQILPPPAENTAQGQQTTPEQPAPNHPQHWGALYPRPPQQTPQPQPTPEPPH